MVEKEYIERERFVHHLENCIYEARNTNGYIEDFETCLKALKNQPTADVQEVVYCKYCKYSDGATVNEKGFLICPASGMEITEYDFCSYGVKMDKDGEQE